MDKPSAPRPSDPANPRFRFQNSPTYWLTRVSARYLQVIERRLKRVGMDVPRWRVLMILAEAEPASVTELSEHAIIKLATMAKIVQRMESVGLVVTRQRATDARVTEVEITATGREALDEVRRVASGVYGRAFGTLSDTELGAMIGLLQRIFKALDLERG